jgi:thiamine biosynthesis lipoprotein
MTGGHLQFDAIGTSWHITTHIPLSVDLKKAIDDHIQTFDKVYSRFRKDSLVTEIAKQEGIYTFPQDAKELFRFYERVYQLTQGQMTPLIGQLLDDAGYDATYSLQVKKLKEIPTWEECITYNHPNLRVRRPVLLDFGAAGKGYLIDLVGQILKKHDMPSFTINAGGDILHQSRENKIIRVGMEHPEDAKKIIGIAYLGNGSICGSAGNRRKWGEFHHIMHPMTKKSVSDVLSVWVIAENGLLADGLATALFFTTPEEIAKAFDFEYCIIKQDYSAAISSNFPGELFMGI